MNLNPNQVLFDRCFCFLCYYQVQTTTNIHYHLLSHLISNFTHLKDLHLNLLINCLYHFLFVNDLSYLSPKFSFSVFCGLSHNSLHLITTISHHLNQKFHFHIILSFIINSFLSFHIFKTPFQIFYPFAGCLVSLAQVLH